MALFELLKNNSGIRAGVKSSEFMWGLDFAAGFLLILCFLLSSTLNPIVFYHYWKLPSTVPNILYRLLALADFTANNIRPLFSAYAHLSPDDITDILLDANIQSSVCTVVVMMSITLSTASVALIALTRAIKIHWPFYRVKKRLIFCWLGVLLTFQLTCIIYFLARDPSAVRNLVCSGTSVAVRFIDLPDGSIGWRVSARTIFAFVIMYVHALISILVSIWAIANLVKAIKQSKLTKNTVVSEEGDRKNERNTLRKTLKKFKSCQAIVLINLTYVAMVVGAVITIAQMPDGANGHYESVLNCRASYGINIVLPSIMAATNPIILIRFNEDIRARFTCGEIYWAKLLNLCRTCIAGNESRAENDIIANKSHRVETGTEIDNYRVGSKRVETNM